MINSLHLHKGSFGQITKLPDDFYRVIPFINMFPIEIHLDTLEIRSPVTTEKISNLKDIIKSGYFKFGIELYSMVDIFMEIASYNKNDRITTPYFLDARYVAKKTFLPEKRDGVEFVLNSKSLFYYNSVVISYAEEIIVKDISFNFMVLDLLIGNRVKQNPKLFDGGILTDHKDEAIPFDLKKLKETVKYYEVNEYRMRVAPSLTKIERWELYNDVAFIVEGVRDSEQELKNDQETEIQIRFRTFSITKERYQFCTMVYAMLKFMESIQL